MSNARQHHYTRHRNVTKRGGGGGKGIKDWWASTKKSGLLKRATFVKKNKLNYRTLIMSTKTIPLVPMRH
jgi:hypothetical protein